MCQQSINLACLTVRQNFPRIFSHGAALWIHWCFRPASSPHNNMVHILLRLLEKQTDQWHRCVSFLSLQDNLNLARTNRALRARYTNASSCAQVLRDLRFGPPAETCFVHELPSFWTSVPTPYQQLVLLVNHLKQCYVCEHFEKNHHYVASKTVQRCGSTC